jgi:hypothetical protein
VPTRTKPITVSQITIARRFAKTGRPITPPRVQPPAQQIDAIFMALDTDGDNVLTIPETRREHRAFAIDMFRKASRSPADSITRAEFRVIQQNRAPQQQRGAPGARGYGPEIVPQIFSRFDGNNDNQLTREEASNPGSLVNEYFDRWDTDGDGVLKREEIVASLRKERAVPGALRGGRN